jgi:dipeptidase E
MTVDLTATTKSSFIHLHNTTFCSNGRNILYFESTKLLLTSRGITNRSIRDAFASLLEKPFIDFRAVYIPTAANVTLGDKEWVNAEMNSVKNLGFLSFEIIDISKVTKNIWLPSFEKADLLVVGGGNSDHLLKWFNSSGVTDILPVLLKTKVYMGISAGSMVTATNISLSSERILYYEKTGKLGSQKGLGFVNFEVRPHLNSPDFPKVRLDYLEKLSYQTPTSFYAIDDQTAIKVDGDKVSVVSEGKWKKFN